MTMTTKTVSIATFTTAYLAVDASTKLRHWLEGNPDHPDVVATLDAINAAALRWWQETLDELAPDTYRVVLGTPDDRYPSNTGEIIDLVYGAGLDFAGAEWDDLGEIRWIALLDGNGF